MHFSYYQNSSSTVSDCLMTLYIQKSYGLFPLIRSFRTTRSKATILLFMDEPLIQSFSEVSLNIINQCSATIINIGTLPKSFHSGKVISFFRYIIYYDFLTTYGYRFKRILITDGFDSIFQVDPFLEKMESDKLYLCIENHDNLFVYHWYSLIPQPIQDTILNNPIVNGGVIAGGMLQVKQYLFFFIQQIRNKEYFVTDNNTNTQVTNNDNKLDKIVTLEDILSCPYVFDQIKLNYYYYTGIMKENNIIPILIPSSGFLSSAMNEMVFHDPLVNYNFGYYGFAGKPYVSLVHQYHYNKPLLKSVLKSCPPLPFQNEPYVKASF